ncbi:MAG: hypothetical protein K2J11_10060 [Oscillospiraceae bacterium]|nr:hypothetical protein [Oscillospiraceae bacterium]
MPLLKTVTNGCETTITLDTEVFERFKKAVEEYQLCMQDFAQAVKIMEKQIPEVERKEDRYGNDYFQCPDCGKKYTYCYFDGYCEKCGKRMIW